MPTSRVSIQKIAKEQEINAEKITPRPSDGIGAQQKQGSKHYKKGNLYLKNQMGTKKKNNEIGSLPQVECFQFTGQIGSTGQYFNK